MSRLIARRRPQLIVQSDLARPMAPLAIQEAVQQWGRKAGRTARLVFVPARRKLWRDGEPVWIDTGLQCWAVELSLRPGDPTLRAWQEGRLRQDTEPTETVLLIAWNAERSRYEPMDIEQLGPSGVVRFLEESDTWSGRGRFKSVAEAIDHVIRRQRDAGERMKEQQRSWARELYEDVRRRIHKIPFLGVGIDLRKGEQP